MKVRGVHLLAVAACAGLGLGLVAVRQPEKVAAGGELTRSQAVTLQGASAARVDIEIGLGQLKLAGGSLASAGSPMPRDELLRGEFEYDEGYEPRVSYKVDGDTGHLMIAQEESPSFTWPWDEHRNAWTLYLNPTVPTDLNVEVGSGESQLALGGLTLTGLNVVSGAGKTTLDCAGDWRSSLRGQVESGAGDLTIRLPNQIGVRVEVDHGFGDIDAEGFSRDGDAYVNGAYGSTPISLDLQVEHGAGDIDLELVG